MTAPSGDIPGSEPTVREPSIDPVRDPTDLVATPDMHQPGQPPGGQGPTGPNLVTVRRRRNPTADQAGHGPTVEGPIEPTTVPVKPPGPPARNASADTWRDYAVQHRGADRDQVEALGRDELVEHYGS